MENQQRRHRPNPSPFTHQQSPPPKPSSTASSSRPTPPAVLLRTLDPAKLAGASLVIGTATDPYQPAERKFKLTRGILEALLGWRGLSLGLITKSPLVTRDLDLLQRLSERHEVSVNISLASLNAPLLRRLERRSPAPHARIRALKTLIDGGIHTGLLIAPILPGITDDRAGLAALMRAAKAAGARYAVGQPLRLGPAIVPQFMPVLEQEFPDLVERYRQHYGHGNYVSAAYKDALMHRLHQLQREFGFPVAESRRRREAAGGKAAAVDAGGMDRRRWLLGRDRSTGQVPSRRNSGMLDSDSLRSVPVLRFPSLSSVSTRPTHAQLCTLHRSSRLLHHCRRPGRTGAPGAAGRGGGAGSRPCHDPGALRRSEGGGHHARDAGDQGRRSSAPISSCGRPTRGSTPGRRGRCSRSCAATLR